MTTPLFPDRDPCGCEKTLGHVCQPPFYDGHEWPENGRWPAESQGWDGKVEGTNKTAPDGSLDTTRRRLTPNKEGLA